MLSVLSTFKQCVRISVKLVYCYYSRCTAFIISSIGACEWLIEQYICYIFIRSIVKNIYVFIAVEMRALIHISTNGANFRKKCGRKG